MKTSSKPPIRRIQAAIAATLTLGSAAATAHDGPSIQRYAVYDVGVAERVAKADWSKAPAVRIEFDGRSYISPTTELKLAAPYRLELVNIGDRPVAISAPELFRTSALATMTSNGMQLKAPYFESMEVMPGGSLKVDLLPMEPGSYVLGLHPEHDADRGLTYSVKVISPQSREAAKPLRPWRLRR